MKSVRSEQNNVNKQNGFISLDFLFGITISFSLLVIFMIVSLTLVMAEVSQYIVFSASRAYSGANATVAAQEALGKAKFQELMGKAMIKAVFKTKGWFALNNVEFGDFSGEYPETDQPENATFVGARANFDARVLRLQLPMLGATTTNSQTGVAKINSFLTREVSTEECRESFIRLRFDKLKDLDTRYKGMPKTAKAQLITDNGC